MPPARSSNRPPPLVPGPPVSWFFPYRTVPDASPCRTPDPPWRPPGDPVAGPAAAPSRDDRFPDLGRRGGPAGFHPGRAVPAQLRVPEGGGRLSGGPARRPRLRDGVLGR